MSCMSCPCSIEIFPLNVVEFSDNICNSFANIHIFLLSKKTSGHADFNSLKMKSNNEGTTISLSNIIMWVYI